MIVVIIVIVPSIINGLPTNGALTRRQILAVFPDVITALLPIIKIAISFKRLFPSGFLARCSAHATMSC